jgi:hypothetical protein
MNLEDIMKNRLPKTAGDSTQAPSGTRSAAQPTSKTASAVEEAIAAVGRPTTKTASTASPAGSAAPVFDKLAAELAAQDQEGSIKMAQLYGAAMADGFMAQIGMYEKVAESMVQQTAKTAAANGAGDLDPELVELVKEAAYDPAGFLARIEHAAMEDAELLKQAEDEEAARMEQAIQVKAAEHYAHGYEIGLKMVSPA